MDTDPTIRSIGDLVQDFLSDIVASRKVEPLVDSTPQKPVQPRFVVVIRPPATEDERETIGDRSIPGPPSWEPLRRTA